MPLEHLWQDSLGHNRLIGADRIASSTTEDLKILRSGLIETLIPIMNKSHLPTGTHLRDSQITDILKMLSWLYIKMLLATSVHREGVGLPWPQAEVRKYLCRASCHFLPADWMFIRQIWKIPSHYFIFIYFLCLNWHRQAFFNYTVVNFSSID